MSKTKKNLDHFRGCGKIANMHSDEILNIRDVSGYLKIPVSTVYKLVQNGKVPAIKLGKHWRFKKKDIDHLFEETVLTKDK